MELLLYIFNALKFDADFEQAKFFLILPFVAALIPFAVATLANRSGKLEMKFKMRWVLFCSVAFYSLGNLAVFSYIFFRPNDPRWALEQRGVQLPGADAPEVNGLPFGNEALNGFIDGITGSLNSSLDVAENRLNEELAPVYDMLAYRNAFDAASDFLLYAGLGLLLMGILFIPLLWLGSRADTNRKRREEDEREEYRDIMIYSLARNQGIDDLPSIEKWRADGKPPGYSWD